MSKAKTNTVSKAQDANAIDLATNVWNSGTRAANALQSAKDDSLAVLSSKQFPLDSKTQIAEDCHDFFVENLGSETLAKVPNKEDKEGNTIYAFRSSSATKVLWQWQTVVAKAVESGADYSDIFEMEENQIGKSGDYKFPTRKQIYDLCSEELTDLEKLQALMITACKLASKIKGGVEIRKAETCIMEAVDSLNKKKSKK